MTDRSTSVPEDRDTTRDKQLQAVRSCSLPTDVRTTHPATAYFWGHVAAAGRSTDQGVEVTTGDERCAAVLATIVRSDPETTDHETTDRQYVHDASITRTEDEYTVRVSVPGVEGDSHPQSAKGDVSIGIEGSADGRFDQFLDYRRDLLRGLFEGCGTICFKSSSGTVGCSFVHEDRAFLDDVRGVIEPCPIDVSMGEVAKASSGRYWFGVDDADAPTFGTWLYEDTTKTGLYAPSRRRKLESSVEQAAAYSNERPDGEES